MASTLEWPDILAVVLYFIVVIGIGLWATCRANTGNSQGYFLAGQQSQWWLIGTSTFATNVGAPMFIGLAGSAASSGIATVMFEWHAMFMLIALGWLFLPVYRASGCFTMPQYLKLRYGRNRIGVTLAIVHTLNTMIASISGQMYAGALFIQIMLGWNLYLSIILILVITAIYTVIGGLTAVLWTDAIQTLILIIGSFILAGISLEKVGGYEAMRNQYKYSMANETFLDYSLYGNRTCGVPVDNAFHIFRPASDGTYPWPGMIFGLTILATNAWCTDQICVQRSLSAKNVAHAKGGVLLAAYLKILPFLFFVIPGMISRVLFPDIIACADPDSCREICGNPSGCTNIAYPILVNNILPNGLRGLMLAALLAALMSSLTSMFNSSSTVFTLDIYKRFKKHAHETELMIVGRIFTCVLVIISILWIPVLQAVQGSNFWDYTQSIYSHILPPIVMSFLLGLFWKRATEKGAFWSMIIGITIGLVRLILTWVIPAPLCGSNDEDRRWPIIYKVHYLHFAMISGAISAILHLCISMMTQPRSPLKIRRVTFWTRNEPELPELSDESSDEEDFKKDLKEKEKGIDEDEVKIKKGGCAFIKQWICGIDRKKQKRLTKEEIRERQLELTNIHEDPKWRKILNWNALICCGVSVFIHAFWY